MAEDRRFREIEVGTEIPPFSNQVTFMELNQFAGANRLLAGSDYPHQIGSIPKMLESIRALEVREAERALIFGGNAARLLKI